MFDFLLSYQDGQAAGLSLLGYFLVYSLLLAPACTIYITRIGRPALPFDITLGIAAGGILSILLSLGSYGLQQTIGLPAAVFTWPLVLSFAAWLVSASTSPVALVGLSRRLLAQSLREVES